MSKPPGDLQNYSKTVFPFGCEKNWLTTCAIQVSALLEAQTVRN